MSVVDVAGPVDEETAGLSTFCIGFRHDSCSLAQVTCSCSCHGPAGQAPPAERPTEPADWPETHDDNDEEPNVSGTETPPQPATLACGECDRNGFLTPHALAVHSARAHGIRGASKGPKAKRTAKATVAKELTKRRAPKAVAAVPTAPAPAADRPVAVVVKRADDELRLIRPGDVDLPDLVAWLGGAWMPIVFEATS